MHLRNAVAAAAGLLTVVALLPAGAAARSVSVTNFSFGPAALEAQPGDEITWTWTQGTHTVTAWSGATFDSLARSGGTFTTTFGSGIVMYRCELHSDLVNGNTDCSGMCGIIGEDVGAPPPPVITSPSSGATVRSPVAIAGTSSDADTITITEAGGMVGQTHTDNDGSWSLNVSLPTGPHALNAFATSMLGIQSAAVTLTIEVDATPPVITLTAPGDLTIHTGEVTIQGEATDAGGVSAFSVTLLPLYGEPLDVPLTCTGCGAVAASFSGTIDPPPGVWMITSKAFDTVGNEGSSAPLRILTA